MSPSPTLAPDSHPDFYALRDLWSVSQWFILFSFLFSLFLSLPSPLSSCWTLRLTARVEAREDGRQAVKAAGDVGGDRRGTMWRWSSEVCVQENRKVGGWGCMLVDGNRGSDGQWREHEVGVHQTLLPHHNIWMELGGEGRAPTPRGFEKNFGA